MTKGIDFTFREVDASSYSRLEEMFLRCFGASVDDRYFKWKYQSNPAGQVVGFEAVDGEKPAGFYGVIPEYYLINGKKTLFFQSMDTMTHPDYRRKGLFSRLAKKTYAEVERRFSGAVLIGIAGNESYPGFVKRLGWKHPHSFKYLFSLRLVFDVLNLFSERHDLQFENVIEFDAEIDDFIESRSRKLLPVEKYLDSEILNWRVRDNPRFSYRSFKFYRGERLAGFMVYHLKAKGIACIDLFDVDREEDCDLLGDVIRHLFKETNANVVFTWEPSWVKLKSAYFKRARFFFNPFRRGPLRYRGPFIFRSNSDAVDGVDFTNIENYNLQPLIQD